MAFGQFQPGQASASPVATGQSYAQSIAGGMPMEQIIAPGVSYSPEQAGGYTQADLDLRNRYMGEGPAPVMPIAPTTGEVATIPNQMPYAPPGVTQPTPFPAVGNFDFLTGLDFSNLPDFSDMDFSNIDIDAALQEYSDRIDAGEPEPLESFFTEPYQVPVMPQAPAYQEPVNFTAVPQAPALAPIMPGIPREPIYDRYIDEQIIPSFIPQSVVNKVPVMPSIPGEPEPFFEPRVPVQIAAPVTPVQKLPQSIFANIPQPVMPQPIPQIPNFEIQQLGLPMNFTGLPQMPFIPESIAFRPQPIPQPIPESITPMPVIPQIPVMPQIPQIAYIPPASSFIQPRVEEIVSPISRGRTRQLPQPGLFNLV